MNRTRFISGHVDLTTQEFEEHYAPQLAAALKAGDSFVVGDCRGADTMAQEWLHRNGVSQVTVFHMLESPRNNAGGFETRGGYSSDKLRDVALTNASTDDIAWVRPGREKSGTAQNLQRRTK